MSARPNAFITVPLRRLLWLMLSCSLLSAGVAAQSLESTASIDVSNLDYNGDTNVLAIRYDSKAGGPAEAILDETPFTGLNDDGSPQTLTFTGGASAFVVAPGQRPGLHASVYGSLLNTFYNVDNPPYFDATVDPPVIDENGVPDHFGAYGKAGIVELFSYGGFGASQYRARYYYHIHGYVSGDGFNSALLIFQVGNNPREFASFQPNLPNGEVVADYATLSYPVANGMSHEAKSALSVLYAADTQSVPEGSDITGSFDFSGTVTLDHIVVVDENNNPVSGWTVTAASGMDYDLPIFRSGFDPVAPDEPAMAANGVEICARLQGVQRVGAKLSKRSDSCDGPVGAIREIKFRRVGTSGITARD